VLNCRRYFDSFAKEKGFDPQDPERWYHTPIAELSKRKVSDTHDISPKYSQTFNRVPRD